MSRIVMGNLGHSIVITVLVLLIFSLAASGGFAYTTEYYDVNVKVNEDNSYEFTETIGMNYDEPRHGIYRYIPMADEDGSVVMKIDKEWVDGWNYETYDEDKRRVIKIGSAHTEVTGEQTFKFGYRMRLYDDMDESRDLLYVDLLNTGWDTPIEKTTINVSLPKAVEKKDIKIYVSKYGSDEVDENVSWKYDEETYEIRVKGTDLEKGVGVTMMIELPEGYWVGQMNREWLRTVMLAMLMGVTALLALFWFMFGRDEQIVETVEFYPPEGLTPAEVGYILDGKVDKKDLCSLLMYFADKGYMSIEQYKKRKFRLHKLSDIPESEKNFTRTLFKALFQWGSEVDMNSLGSSFGYEFTRARKQLIEAYSPEGAQKKKTRNWIFICAIISGLSMYLLPNLIFLMNSFVSIGIILFGTIFAAVTPFIIGIISAIVRTAKSNTQMTMVSSVLQIVSYLIISVMIILVPVVCNTYHIVYNQYIGSMYSIAIAAAVLLVTSTNKLSSWYKKRFAVKDISYKFKSVVLWILDGCLIAAETTFVYLSFDSIGLALLAAGCILACQIFTIMMEQRTKENRELIGKILGLKNFIREAELDRINMLVEENPHYFYNVLPYAFVMGLTDKWAKNFERINIETPEWYSEYEGGISSFDAWSFSRAMTTFGNEISSIRISTGSSGSDDFGGSSFSSGGGGHSGGGHGGGGGGSW